MHRPPTPLLAVLLAGCTSLDGMMEGEDVGEARDAFYDTELWQAGAFRYRLFAVFVTTASDGCEGLDRLEEVEGQCGEQCADIVEIADDHLTGDVLWTLALLYATTSEVEQEYAWDDPDEDASFSASLSRVDISEVYDAEVCKDACLDGDLLTAEAWAGKDGTGEIRSWEDGGSLSGRFEVEFENGYVEGRFHADECAGLF